MTMNFKIISKTFAAALVLTTILSSCMKDNDIEPQPIAGLNIIHGTPGTQLLDYYVDATRANTADFAYGNTVGYLRLFPGERQISIAKKGENTPLLAQKFQFEGTLGYSLFIANKLENVEYLFLKDDLTLPAAGKAHIRFVNLSPDAPELSLAIAGKESDLISKKKFKEYSTFVAMDAAEKVTFILKNTETGAPEATFADVKIEQGKIYTVWAKGLKAATDNTKLGVAVFQHK